MRKIISKSKKENMIVFLILALAGLYFGFEEYMQVGYTLRTALYLLIAFSAGYQIYKA